MQEEKRKKAYFKIINKQKDTRPKHNYSNSLHIFLAYFNAKIVRTITLGNFYLSVKST